jgi:thiol-disulfide isomerase/thioredoxin
VKTRLLIVAIAAVVVVGYIVYRHQFRAGLAGNSLAPDFSLTDLNGQTVSLSGYRGKVVLLNFWATWCEPCRSETPRLVALQDKYRGQGFQVIGVSLDDDRKDVPPFYEEFHMNYPVVVGDSHLADRFGGVLGLPVSFFIGCNGRIESRHVGELNVEKVDPEIRKLLESSTCTAEHAGERAPRREQL